jgi:hypothetical protein
MQGHGNPASLTPGDQKYEDFVIGQFRSVAKGQYHASKSQYPPVSLPINRHQKLKVSVLTIGDKENSQTPKEMEYFECALTYKKRGFCGSKKMTINIDKIDIGPSTTNNTPDKKTAFKGAQLEVVATTDKGERLGFVHLKKAEIEAIEADLLARDAMMIASVRKNGQKLREAVFNWRCNFYGLIMKNMLEFNQVYEIFDQDEREAYNDVPNEREADWNAYKSPVEHYSDIAVRINEDKDLIMDPPLRSLEDSLTNYRTIKLGDAGLVTDVDRETLGKDKYQNKLDSQRKTNLLNLTEFKDAKDLRSGRQGTNLKSGPVTISLAASHHPADLRNIKKNLECQIMASVIFGQKFKYLSLAVEIVGSQSRQTSHKQVETLRFQLAPDKFSETPMTHIFKPEKVCDLSRYSEGKIGLIVLRLSGVSEKGQDLLIGSSVLLLADMVELFEVFNHNIVSLPLLQVDSRGPCRGVLILTKKPIQDVERFSHQLDDGLFTELVKSPQFEIFSRNSMTQFNYNSGEVKSQILQASSPFLPAHQYRPSGTVIDLIDISELLTNQKLRSLVWDTLQYTTPQSIQKLSAKTEDFLKLAILSRQDPSKSMNQSLVLTKSSINDMAKSKILNDIKNIQQEDLKLEVFDLRLSESFLTNWGIIERTEHFHQRLWMMLSPKTQISFQRFKKADILKIRLQIMNQLFYFILRDYYCKPSILSQFKLGNDSFRTGFEVADDQRPQSLKNHPLFINILKGLSKDYFLLTMFLIEKCPLLIRKIALTWQGSILFLLPKILDLLSDLLTNHKFISLLDKLFGADRRLKSRSHTLSQLLCIALHMLETKSANGVWLLEGSNDSFDKNFRSFMQLNEEKVFVEYEKQLQENLLRQEEGNKNLISNIFVSIQEAVTVANTLSWLENATKSLQSNASLQAFLKFNSFTNSVALKLLDIAQNVRMKSSQILSLVSKPEEEANWRIFFRVTSFGKGKYSSAAREGSEKCIIADLLSMDSPSSLKLRVHTGDSKASIEIDLTKEGTFQVNELTLENTNGILLTADLVEVDAFDLFREPQVIKIGSSVQRIDTLRKDQVHPIEICIHHPYDYYQEYWLQLKVLVTSYSTLQNVKDESMMMDMSDKSQIKDNFSIEKKVLFESRNEFEVVSGGHLLAEELTAANFVQSGPYKINIASVEAVTSRRCFNHLARVYNINPATAAAYNYFQSVQYYKERTIGYMQIVKNLSYMEEVENVRVDPSMQKMEEMGSLSLLLRMLIFNDDTEMLLNCLVGYFGRDCKTLMAADLVFIFTKLLEIVHLKPHALEVADYLEMQLDGINLRPRLVSLSCILSDMPADSLLQQFCDQEETETRLNTSNPPAMIDLTNTANEILYWMSFKNNCPKLILGDTSSLYVLQEMVFSHIGSTSLNTDHNLVSYSIEFNSHVFKTMIPFDRYFRPLTHARYTPESWVHSSSPGISKPQMTVLFSMDEYSIDLRPLTSLPINRVDLCRLFQSSSLAAYVKDLSKF